MSGLGSSWKEEGEDLVEAVGPGVLIVRGAGNDQQPEVLVGGGAVVPAALQEETVKQFNITDVTLALGGSDVEPDTKVRFGSGVGDEGQDGAVVPPDGRAENGEFAEDLGVLQPEIEADEGAERGATEAGGPGTGEGAEGGVDERLQLLDEESAVAVAFAATHAEIAGRGVFGHAAETGVGNADENDGLDDTLRGEAVCGGFSLPGSAGDVGGLRVDEVLAVMEVEDGKAAGGIGGVRLGQVDGDLTRVRIGQDGGVKQKTVKARDWVTAGRKRDEAGGTGLCRNTTRLGGGRGGAWTGRDLQDLDGTPVRYDGIRLAETRRMFGIKR